MASVDEVTIPQLSGKNWSILALMRRGFGQLGRADSGDSEHTRDDRVHERRWSA